MRGLLNLCCLSLTNKKPVGRLLFLLFFCVIFYGCGFFPHTLPGILEVKDLNDPSDEILLSTEERDADTFKGKKPVDILFVVDTSYSMVQYLKKVDQTFKDFIPTLSPVSWKIAFTNADYDPNAFSYYGRDLFKGKIMKLELNGNILPYSTLHVRFKSNKEIFIDTLKRYEQGDVSHFSPDQYINPCDLPPYCQGNVRTPVYSLISSFSANKNVFRNHADFVAVIFTNGDDMYSNNDTANLMMEEFRKHHGRKKKINVYSISIIPGDEKCFNYDQANQYNYASSHYGEKVHEVVQTTGGKAISICAPNYSPLASEIVRSTLNNTSDGSTIIL